MSLYTQYIFYYYIYIHIYIYIYYAIYFKKYIYTYRYGKFSPCVIVQRQRHCFGSPLHMELELVLPSKGMEGDQK